MKVADQLTLKQGAVLDYQGGPDKMKIVPKRKERFVVRGSQDNGSIVSRIPHCRL